MRCTQVQGLLSDLHNGELSLRKAQRLRGHLRDCAACRRAEQELEELLTRMARVEPPRLPEDFSASLHRRLAEENQRTGPEPGQRWAAARPLWLRTLRGAALVFAGAAGAALLLWVWPTAELSGAHHSVSTPTQPPGHSARAVAPTSEAPSQHLRLGQVAVLVVSIRADTAKSNANLNVVLPDGVALLGEGHKVLEERRMTWRADLAPGDNVIRIPVQARRAGTWLLVARAQSEGFHATAETRLVVTKSKT